jgi:hypothetical protein
MDGRWFALGVVVLAAGARRARPGSRLRTLVDPMPIWQFEEPKESDYFEDNEDGWADAKWAVTEDYKNVLGKVGLVYSIGGYIDEDSVDFDFKTPIRVRVTETHRDTLLNERDDGFIDPSWYVDLIDPLPAVDQHGTKTKGLRSTHIYGRSVRVKSRS